MSWCHRFKISLRARHIPGCLNVITDSLSRSTQIQSTEWSLHAQVFKRICKRGFTPQVDLFATRLNHKLPLYVSPVPDQNAWNIDALNISWLSLLAYAYPPMSAMQILLGISPVCQQWLIYSHQWYLAVTSCPEISKGGSQLWLLKVMR